MYSEFCTCARGQIRALSPRSAQKDLKISAPTTLSSTASLVKSLMSLDNQLAPSSSARRCFKWWLQPTKIKPTLRRCLSAARAALCDPQEPFTVDGVACASRCTIITVHGWAPAWANATWDTSCCSYSSSLSTPCSPSSSASASFWPKVGNNSTRPTGRKIWPSLNTTRTLEIP